MNRRCHMLLCLVVGLLVATKRISIASAFAPALSTLTTRSSLSVTVPQVTRRQSTVLRFAKQDKKQSDDGDEDDEEVALGMEQAFEKLESLASLDEDSVSAPPKKRPTTKETSSSSLPLEQEIEVYKNLVGESESKQDVYSDVLADMVTEKSTSSSTSAASSTSSNILDDPAMQQALAEAMQEAAAKNPNTASSSPLDDQEIMEEIKVIMERGNAELLASLEEIRQEQVRIRRCGFIFVLNTLVVACERKREGRRERTREIFIRCMVTGRDCH